MSEKEQKTIQTIKTKRSRKEAETLLGVSRTRISQILTQSGRTLRQNAKKRLIQEVFHRREQSPFICSILPMEDITQEGILSFFYTAMFINRTYGPIQFRIYGNDDRVSFSRLLKLFAEFLSVSTISRNYSKELKDLGVMIGELYLSFNIEQETLGEEELFEMIRQADFCICSLSSPHISEKIRNCISAEEHVVLLDISKGLPQIERKLQ